MYFIIEHIQVYVSVGVANINYTFFDVNFHLWKLELLFSTLKLKVKKSHKIDVWLPTVRQF